jgi:hypothetical protein
MEAISLNIDKVVTETTFLHAGLEEYTGSVTEKKGSFR